ncbi:MAG TPA: diaminopimelate decarboxylase [Candidatus Eisenbacteria bacterium]|nr:diaminopimelate decarboxylase [Candidatus Eisenbacteria bacterium]
MLDLSHYPLDRLASRVGTPFYLHDAGIMRGTVSRFAELVREHGLFGRYAVKANAARPVLELMRAEGLGVDAGSGNEVLRARRAGFPGGSDPAVIMLTTDVFRDNALDVVSRERVLPNVGSPRMIRELRDAGYRGPVGVRINPGFGHGVVEACDTGGPSSKHGIWLDALDGVRRAAADAGLPVAVLHAHVGTGPTLPEFDTNVRKLVDLFVELLPDFPEVGTVNLGGGIPHPYRPQERAYDLASYRPIWDEAVARLSQRAARPIRVEVEPGRYLVAGAGILVTRVKEVKETRTNEKGRGHTFVMVDAGFCDLLRPALYGSYHEIEVVSAGAGGGAASGGAQRPSVSCVVAGPLCESGDVFTRSETELLDPRMMPRPEAGDLLVVQDAGAYGAVMSSNYLSMGRAAEVWWEDGHGRIISRRETLEDLVARECDVAL